MRKSLIAALTISIFLLNCIGVAFSSETGSSVQIGHIWINDVELTLNEDEGTFWVDDADRTQAPFRALVEGLGYECQWDAATMTVTVPGGPSGDIVMQINQDYIKIGDEIKPLDTKPVIKDDKTYIPLRALAEALNFYVTTSGFRTGVGNIFITTEYREQEPEPEPAPVIEPVAPTYTYDVILGQYTTWFSSSSANRKENVQIAAQSLHGVVIQPGEEFSFNQTTGAITKARGYKDATVIENGKYVTGVGGGVCQVSTTLFNAALESNMTITSRTPHSLQPSYVPGGRDAAITSYQDFKFINPYDEPVMIMITCEKSQGLLAISIRGTYTTPPYPTIKVSKYNGTYTLTRTVDGIVNYTCSTRYK